MAPDTAANTYADGSGGLTLTLVRTGLRNMVVDGSLRRNLRIVCSPKQYDALKAQHDDQIRYDGQSSEFGFIGDIRVDGIPVIVDKDCPDASLFVIDIFHHRVAIWVPPVLEILGKRSDAVEGFVKAYIATYNTAPRRIYEVHSLP